MKNEKSIFEIVRRISELKEDLDSITKLKKEAFSIFERPNCSLKKILQINDSSWEELWDWNVIGDVEGERKHNMYLQLPEEHTIRNAFLNLGSADINRNEFFKILEESRIREYVEVYIKELEEEISKQQKELDKLYNKFVKDSGEFSFIFKEPKIKEVIINKLLQI